MFIQDVSTDMYVMYAMWLVRGNVENTRSQLYYILAKHCSVHVAWSAVHACIPKPEYTWLWALSAGTISTYPVHLVYTGLCLWSHRFVYVKTGCLGFNITYLV